MKRIASRLAFSMFLVILMLALPPASPAAPLDDEAFVRVAEKVGPSVVTISVRISGEFTSRSQKLFEESNGSGFIIDEAGYIVTNRHVVNGATSLAVKLADGREFEATLINIHPTMDTALIKIKNPPADLVPAKLGDSAKLKVGQWVAAIGAPFGFANTLTKGIISALDRPAEIFIEKDETSPSHTFIQHDAAVNPGNSGGPLVNLQGEVIGINTLIASPERGNVGLSFAIPINAVKDALPKLKSATKTAVGWLGFKTQKLDEDLRAQLKIAKDQDGLVVTMLEKTGPADKAGIKVLDLILEVEKDKFSDPLAFEQFVQNQDAGKEL
ncbi:MAG: trypsin-like peptidase domain-containing protein, partial [Candidatus Sungiibacteriota bacterium]